MTNSPPVRNNRSYTTLAAAIIIAAVVISAAIFTSSALYTTITRTQTTTTTIFTQQSTTTGISTSTTSSSTTANSFTYSPHSPVQIDSVTAATSTTQNGTIDVAFQILFKNNGPSSIYYIGGCGSSLSTSIPAGSTVLKQGSNRTPCLCSESLMPLKSGQNTTSMDPGCWSQYYYQLGGHGTIEMNMTLAWSTNSQNFAGTNSTSIQAQFTF
jgi:hypothetical protein